MADKIAEKMREGVDQGVFPGGVLLVSHKGRTVHHAAYGAACLLPKPRPRVHGIISVRNDRELGLPLE